MSTVDRVITAIFVAGFVFCSLAALSPVASSREAAHGKMLGALFAAIFAGAVAWELGS